MRRPNRPETRYNPPPSSAVVSVESFVNHLCISGRLQGRRAKFRCGSEAAGQVRRHS